jgi:hypothetical protein
VLFPDQVEDELVRGEGADDDLACRDLGSVGKADLLIGAVLIVGAEAPKLITRKMERTAEIRNAAWMEM